MLKPSEKKTPAAFRFGDWRIEPATNAVWKDDQRKSLEPRAMDVLVLLCSRHNEVVSAQDILDACWGPTFYGDNPIHKVLSQIRQALGDSATGSTYIATIRKRGYRAIAEVQYDLADKHGRWLHCAPFPGLEAFRLEHAQIFFGRGPAALRLDEALRQQAELGCAMVVLLGPSGSGKTSLVQAGLLERLMAHPPEGRPIASALTLDCADVADIGPLEALASVLLDAECGDGPVFAGISALELAARLAGDVASVLVQLGERLAGTRLFLFVDRLEAVFRLAHLKGAPCTDFVAVLAHLARSGHVLIVIACRNDFYPDVMASPVLRAMKLSGGHVDLDAPDATDMAQIIRQPALMAGLRFEVDEASGSGLDELLCIAADKQADILPLLAYCLHELYRRRSDDGMLTLAVFRELGGIDGAIGARAEQVVAGLGAAEAAALPRVLSRLVEVQEHHGIATPRHASWEGLRPGPEQQLVRALIDARLFVSDLVAGTPTYCVAHEAVLRRWPRAVDWIEKHHQALSQRARVGSQARHWEDAGKPPGLLLAPGIQAQQGGSLMTLAELSLSTLEREFITASLHSARRHANLRISFGVLMCLLAVIAIILGLAARTAQNHAERHRTEAEGLMAHMLSEFVSQLRPLGRLDLLDSVSTRALGYLANLGDDQSDNKSDQVALTQRAKALQLIAEVKIARADPIAAKTALLAAREILGQQRRVLPDDKAVLTDLGANAFWLGQIAFDQDDWPTAQAYFEQYQRDSDALSALAPANVDAWIEQGYAHNSLGSVAMKQGQVGVAARQFALSVALKRRALAHKRGDATLVADLADSLSWLASTREQLGELASAMTLYEQEQALLLPLHRDTPGDGLWSHRYAFSLWHQAELALAMGNGDLAKSSLQRAAGLLGELVRRDPSNRTWQMDAHNAQLKLLALDADSGEPSAALARLNALGAAFSALSKLEPKKTILLRLLASSNIEKAKLHLRQARPDLADAALMPALASLETLYARAPADAKMRDALFEARFAEASVAAATLRHERRMLACRRVHDVAGAPGSASMDYHLLAPWVRALHCMDQAGKAADQQRRLAAMGYRDRTYQHEVSSHRSTTLKAPP